MNASGVAFAPLLLSSLPSRALSSVGDRKWPKSFQNINVTPWIAIDMMCWAWRLRLLKNSRSSRKFERRGKHATALRHVSFRIQNKFPQPKVIFKSVFIIFLETSIHIFAVNTATYRYVTRSPAGDLESRRPHLQVVSAMPMVFCRSRSSL